MYTNFLQEMTLWLVIVSALERSIVEGNVHWDLKMMSAIERCAL